MDFSWTPYFTGFWLFPLLCLLFMAVMMLGCWGMRFGCGHGARRETDRDRRYASWEIGKEQ